MSHFPIRLISSHMSKDGGADGTLGPFFIAYQLQKTTFMILMRAAKHKHIIIKIPCKFLFHLLNLKLLQTNHAFLIFHLTFTKLKLQSRIVADLKYLMVLLLLKVILLVYEIDHKLNCLEVFVLTVNCVFVIQVYLQLSWAGQFEEEGLRFAWGVRGR